LDHGVTAGMEALPAGRRIYVTLQLVDGKAKNGAAVSATGKDHVRATGFLRDVSYSESPATFLRKARRFDWIHDRDQEVTVGRVATFVILKTRFG